MCYLKTPAQRASSPENERTYLDDLQELHVYSQERYDGIIEKLTPSAQQALQARVAAAPEELPCLAEGRKLGCILPPRLHEHSANPSCDVARGAVTSRLLASSEMSASFCSGDNIEAPDSRAPPFLCTSSKSSALAPGGITTCFVPH
jgi:hypothetical protein